MNIVRRIFDNEIQVREGGCTVTIVLRRDSWYLCSLMTDRKQRRQGHATSLLKQILRAARRLGKRVELVAGPYDNKPLNLDQLVAFYERCGFRPSPYWPRHPSDWCVEMEFNPS